MMKYVNMLNKITKIIQEAYDKNYIVIGDNSIGKSELLKQVVVKTKLDNYYIDSVNRSFDVKSVNLSQDKANYKLNSNEIVSVRIKEDFFNLKDSFGKNDHIERLYSLYEKDLKVLLKDFLGIDFVIERGEFEYGFGEGEITTKIDGQKVELSSGYQAIVRIFSELILYNEYLNEKGIVIIDEIDEFLSPKNSSEILNYLIKQFPNNKFIVSTHSSDLIANSNNAVIIAMEKEDFSMLDSNDFTTLTEVNTLFEKIFKSKHKEKDDLLNGKLQRLLDLKIINSWSKEEETEFEKINFDKLTSTQKLIYKQIKEW